MANNCWNWVHISGPKETLDIIEERLKKYDDWKGTFTEFCRMVLGIEPDAAPDYETSNEMFSRIYSYGTKWWVFEIERGGDWMEIRGDSAWSPPLGLLTMITRVFDVKINGEYSEPGCNFGGFYTIEDGECEDREMTYFEYDLECGRKETIGRLINDINEDFIDLKYAEDEYKKHLTDKEWNEVLTETNNK